MTDFLTNLAARALGQERPVRPQVPSLFEPSSLAEPVIPSPAVIRSQETTHTHTDRFYHSTTNRVEVERKSLETIHEIERISKTSPAPNQVEPPTTAPTVRTPAAQAAVRSTPPQPLSVAAPSIPKPKATSNVPPPVAEPSIRIHIGRVDVRAIYPAAPAQSPSRSKSPARSVSLDEYLRLHS